MTIVTLQSSLTREELKKADYQPCEVATVAESEPAIDSDDNFLDVAAILLKEMYERYSPFES